MSHPRQRGFLLLLLAASWLSGCAIDRALLASFYADDDPQLVGDALPTMIKLSETLIYLSPEQAKNYFQTGMLLTVYASAFVQTPAEQLGDEFYQQSRQQLGRAKKLYLRGRRYLLRAVQLRFPSWGPLEEEGLTEKQLYAIGKHEYETFHWLALSWLAALAVDPFDFQLLNSVATPVQILFRLLQIDDQRDDIHNSLLTLFAALPESMIEQVLTAQPLLLDFYQRYYQDVDGERVDYHFQQALSLSKGDSPGALVSMAKVEIKRQNRQRFSALLEQALRVDLEEWPDNKLLISVYQQQATWLLVHADDFFL